MERRVKIENCRCLISLAGFLLCALLTGCATAPDSSIVEAEKAGKVSIQSASPQASLSAPASAGMKPSVTTICGSSPADADTVFVYLTVNAPEQGKSLMIDIPYGTVFHDRGGKTQDLMIEHPITFLAGGAKSSALGPSTTISLKPLERRTIKLSTWCLDRCAPAPATDGDTDYTVIEKDVEADRVARLSVCLDSPDLATTKTTRRQKQMAVWLVSHNLFNLSESALLAEFRQMLRPSIEKGLREDINTRGEAFVTKRMGNVSPEVFESAKRNFFEKRFDQIVDKLIERDIRKDWSKTRQIMLHCGVDLKNGSFLASK